MTIDIVDAERPDAATIGRAAAVVAAGGVVAYPTDTFYALGADPRRVAGVAAVFDAKGRDHRESLPLIAGSLDDIERVLGLLPPMAQRLAGVFWPGPLTLVVPLAAGALDPRVSAGRATVAVRVPGHAVARAFASAAGGLLTSTSANRSGEPPATTAVGVLDSLAGSLGYVLDGGTTPGGPASTIVDVCASAPRLIRAGQVPFDRVLESLR
jgi:L-threonylcarbamoyladenylate synthase